MHSSGRPSVLYCDFLMARTVFEATWEMHHEREIPFCKSAVVFLSCIKTRGPAAILHFDGVSMRQNIGSVHEVWRLGVHRPHNRSRRDMAISERMTNRMAIKAMPSLTNFSIPVLHMRVC